MELKEKVAYIKGMMEGMEFDTATKEGKLLAAVVDVLEEMAKEVTNIDEDGDTFILRPCRRSSLHSLRRRRRPR